MKQSSQIRILVRWLGIAALILGGAYLSLRFVVWRIEATWIERARTFARTEGNPVVRALYKYREDTGKWPADIFTDLVLKYVNHVELGIWFDENGRRPILSRNCRPFVGADDVSLVWDFETKTWKFGNIDFGPLGAFEGAAR